MSTRAAGPFISLLAALTCTLALSGCASTAGQWQAEPTTASADADETELAAIQELLARAGEAPLLAAAIKRLENLRQSAPANRQVLIDLAEAEVLYGAAHARSRREKRAHFITAQQHAESVLLQRPGFRLALAAGKRPGLAAAQLEREDVSAMVVWATATSYLFDEGMSAFGRVRNFRGLEDLRLMMERALELDPYYEYGLVPFSLAIFYIATPVIAGGNLQRAAELIEQAVATPGVSLLPHWGRARYLHPLMGDEQARLDELRWIVAQDPAAVDSPYRWNVYVQRDARRLLGGH
ncbi:MAG: hypothetical protein JJU31_16375 [Wenzhouxiangella sp.]|nr:hypothetical protein [Wenzhouxiangella sp.]MCH8478008.1 TRAP transporter TatT component family protein [Wenzhouxiangella sp.]